MEQEIEKVIVDIERQTSPKVVAVVTDNARNMRSATQRIQSRRNVVGGGCSAHVLNLLMKDICKFPSVKAVHSRAVALTRFVRDHLALLDEFKRLQEGVRRIGARARNLVLPVPTRWYSVFSCLQNVMNNREILEKLFVSPEYEQFRDRYRGTAPRRKKLEYLMALVRDDKFWVNLALVVRLLDPIIKALKYLEADKNFVSGVYKWFRWLRYHEAFDDERLQAAGNYEKLNAIETTELQHFVREKIKNRWNYVHTNSMSIGFMLDPSTNLDDFVGKDNDKVDKQILRMAKRCNLTTTSNDPKLTAEILSFKRWKQRGGASARDQYSQSSPRDYWGAKRSQDYPLLTRIAEFVFAIPTSSAASERAWSIFDHIHSKRRNRLSVEKVEMLASIYINYGTIKKGEVDLARHQSCPESVEDN
ncbi:hypothetical protein PHMEG_00028088 [Phytophthora megakarya]|uniref:HAT C-terminal dimerisation domain-containing protein n=1 Tax=Phytophthora megakarya TaxID=4795 RepID=A0A225V5U6_9STRA|nr:hypothetical protein PHMEG_00028088 [Phytophthora megakarya]